MSDGGGEIEGASASDELISANDALLILCLTIIYYFIDCKYRQQHREDFISMALFQREIKENEEEKKRSKLKKENADLSMVDEIMALIMERGILQ